MCVVLPHVLSCIQPIRCMYLYNQVEEKLVQAVHATHYCVSGHVMWKASVWSCVVKDTRTLNSTTLLVLSIVMCCLYLYIDNVLCVCDSYLCLSPGYYGDYACTCDISRL